MLSIESLILLQLLVPTTFAQGSWGPLIDFPIIPVAAYVIPEAPEATRLMFFSAWSPTAFGGERGITQFAEFNYRTGEISQRQVSNTQVRIFWHIRGVWICKTLTNSSMTCSAQA